MKVDRTPTTCRFYTADKLQLSVPRKAYRKIGNSILTFRFDNGEVFQTVIAPKGVAKALRDLKKSQKTS